MTNVRRIEEGHELAKCTRKYYEFLSLLSRHDINDEEFIDRQFKTTDFKLMNQIKQIRQFIKDNPIE